MAKQHTLFQMTTFVDNANVETFSDGSKITRNPRCGQWVRLGWLDRRSRFIGTTRSGVIVMDHTSGGDFKSFSRKVQDFKSFSRKVQAFKRANDPQLRLF